MVQKKLAFKKEKIDNEWGKFILPFYAFKIAEICICQIYGSYERTSSYASRNFRMLFGVFLRQPILQKEKL